MLILELFQQSLETESRAKAEAVRMKKKLEAVINELEIALEHANAANAEAQRTIKKYQQQIKEAQGELEGEQNVKDKTRYILTTSPFDSCFDFPVSGSCLSRSSARRTPSRTSLRRPRLSWS